MINFIASVENTILSCRGINEIEKEKLRQQVVTSVQSVRKKDNVTAEEKKALKELQED